MTTSQTSPSTTHEDSPQLDVTTAQEVDSAPENEDQGLLVSQPQQDNSDTDKSSIVAKFMGCIETLKKENGNLILTILKHVEEYRRADFVTADHNIQFLQLHQDDNLVLDSLPSGVINDLGKSIRLMVAAGLENACLLVYRTCRREFLNEILSALKELNMEDINEVAKMRHTIKALLVANRIVLPNERRLYERVFHSFVHRQAVSRSSPEEDTVTSSKIEILLHLNYGIKEKSIVPSSRIHWITLLELI
ncbi:unnamed protein product [Sphenostylis stenocarpa]|uniref:Uncharacterized protein n=1 Tax=Sphenostylis stenocarpa TaxID=92480 RepID=A0AA86SYF1_9FABA|nr:unnamed protein product [Sphenostylis stenocarpa]